jgi:hypothetical protein
MVCPTMNWVLSPSGHFLHVSIVKIVLHLCLNLFKVYRILYGFFLSRFSKYFACDYNVNLNGWFFIFGSSIPKGNKVEKLHVIKLKYLYSFTNFKLCIIERNMLWIKTWLGDSLLTF